MGIRDAKVNDVSELVRMIGDFARFEKLEAYLEVTDESLFKAMFGSWSHVEVLIAEEDGELAGYALFYPNFSSFRGQRGYFLEDLYVDQRFRGRGIGKEFIREIARRGAERGFERIDFQVLQWNTPAIGFYEALGAVRDDDERHFKFIGRPFGRLAES